jgi:hypothetical protein
MVQDDSIRSDRAAFNAVDGNAAAAAPMGTASLATLLTGHILQDGEVVLIVTKPSRLFVILSGLKFIAVVCIGMIAAHVFNDRIPGRSSTYSEAGIVLIAARVVWAVMQWMSKLYILTDLRIIRLEGVFSLDIFDCPLRKVARTRLLRCTRERLTGLGTIEIIPTLDHLPAGLWQMIRKPRVVLDQIVAAVNRAQQGGPGCR